MPGVRILLVNDEIFLLNGYEGTLEEHFEVLTAENGMQALQIVSSNPPEYFDAIILDINMPIMDGFEACQKIDQNLHQRSEVSPYKTKIYALTADDMEETNKAIEQHPFTCKFSTLSVDVEIARIKRDIQQSNVAHLDPYMIEEEKEEDSVSSNSLDSH